LNAYIFVICFQRTITFSSGIKLSRQSEVAGNVRGRFTSRVGT